MKITIDELPEDHAPRRPARERLLGRRVRQPDGSHVVHYRLDATDSEVGNDVLVLFRRNAARARRLHRERLKAHGAAAE